MPNMQPVAEQAFACAVCSAQAGLVRLFGPEDPTLLRSSFTSEMTAHVSPGAFEPLRSIILSGDARRLYHYDLEAASFYCPDCNLSYCGAHWTRWDVFDDDGGFHWHDSIRGRCPQGHERMLED